MMKIYGHSTRFFAKLVCSSYQTLSLVNSKINSLSLRELKGMGESYQYETSRRKGSLCIREKEEGMSTHLFSFLTCSTVKSKFFVLVISPGEEKEK